NNWHTGAENQSSGVCLCKESKVLGKHIAGFQVGNDQNLSPACHWRFDTLDSRSLGINSVVEGERTIKYTAGDLPAVRHLAQGRSFDGRRDFRRDGLDSGENGHARRSQADLREKINRILDDVALGIEVGKDVDRGIRDEQRLLISRHIHDEDMADAPLGAQARARSCPRPHQLVCWQAPLHQKLALPRLDELDGLGSGRIAVRRIDDLVFANVDAVLARYCRDLCGWSDQDRLYDAKLRRLDGAAQRRFVARVHDHRDRGMRLFRPTDQTVIFRSGSRTAGAERDNVDHLMFAHVISWESSLWPVS